MYLRSPDNLGRLVAALRPFDPYLRDAPPGLPFEWTVETLARGLNFTLTTAVGDLDLFGEIIGGGGYADLEPSTVTMDFFDRPCRLPTLIRVKRAAGRPRDLEAIAELEALLEERDRE